MVAKKKRWISLCMLTVLSSVLFAGCGSNNTTTQSNANKNDSKSTSLPVDTTPITLKVGGDFDKDPGVLDLLQKKFPNITFVFHDIWSTGLAPYIASNDVPDIIEDDSKKYRTAWDQYGVLNDLTPYVNKYKVDLTRYNPSLIQGLYNDAPAHELYALPYKRLLSVLFYNKDIFDKFGVPYPKDGMTWPEVIDLAKKVTLMDGGKQYRGLELRAFGEISNEYPLEYVDPKTDNALLMNDQWTKFFQFVKDVYSIPGNFPTKAVDDSSVFVTDRNVAMWPFPVGIWGPFKDPFNWDMVTLPTFPDTKTHEMAASIILSVNPKSNYKDQAFQVIQYLGSNEVQAQLAKDGNAPVINDPSVMNDWGSDIPMLIGKHRGAVDLNAKAAVKPRGESIYDDVAWQVTHDNMKELIDPSVDLNTALRDTADKINKAIDKVKQQSH